MPVLEEELSVLKSCKPLGERIFVEILPVEISKTLLAPTIEYISGHARKKQHFEYGVRHGKVIGVGPRVLTIKEGDVVVFRGDVGKWVLSDDFRSLKEEEVLAVEDA